MSAQSNLQRWILDPDHEELEDLIESTNAPKYETKYLGLRSAKIKEHKSTIPNTPSNPRNPQ